MSVKDTIPVARSNRHPLLSDRPIMDNTAFPLHKNALKIPANQ